MTTNNLPPKSHSCAHCSPKKRLSSEMHFLSDADSTMQRLTFVLTSGGHNAGIVSEPGHPHRHFQIKTHGKNETHPSHEGWRSTTEQHEGSWWPSWHEWLVEKSSGMTKPPSMGNAKTGFKPLRDAPGEYVLMK